MKIVVKQKSFMLMVPHKATLESAFIWWIKKKNRYCRSFCPLCEYYFRCQEDVTANEIYGE